MRWVQIVCLIIVIDVFMVGIGDASTLIDFTGTLTNAKDEPIANAMVTLEQDAGQVIRKAVSNTAGRFGFQKVSPRVATLTVEANGYTTMREQGVQLADQLNLLKTLQEVQSVGGWWTLLLLLPAVLGLGVATVKEEWKRRTNDHQDGAETENPQTDNRFDNPFLVALLNGVIWTGTLALLLWQGVLASQHVHKLQLFHPSLAFDFYVPVLGFLGALLYVLDLSRRGREDIPKGTEFGMRLVIGPYVAIVMVVLFAHELAFVDLTSAISKGAIAFFSGLLVVLAVQGLIEKGQEWLGQWRQQSRYVPSPVAKRCDLTQEEDLTLRKAGIRHPTQLLAREEAVLREEVKKVGFDDDLVVSLQRDLVKERLHKAIGKLAWEKLAPLQVTIVEEFAHLTDTTLDSIAETEPSLVAADLKALRDQAKKFGTLQSEERIQG